MFDYFTLGSVPCDEDCSQVGSNDYHEKSRIECQAYKKQLLRLFPNAYFKIKGFPHDFGTYHEVVVMFTEDDEAEVRQAIEIEDSLPENWDDEAKKELTAYGYFK